MKRHCWISRRKGGIQIHVVYRCFPDWELIHIFDAAWKAEKLTIQLDNGVTQIQFEEWKKQQKGAIV